MTDPVVRYVTSSDLELWKDVRLRSLAESPDAFGSTLAREEAFGEADWLDRLAPPAVLVLADDAPVGLGGGFEVEPGTLLVVAMWLEPAWRGRGLSRRILDLVVAWARQRGLRVELDVTEGNGPARAAYLAYGFVPTGHVEPLREGSPLRVERMELPA
ncbi:GNAT family N-acetyltransferase [Luteipulveratus sp. YIM 133132]|uniref:GNAT family N-acetyltransferase n=1 Tax=Luteipulveratus flavus TaxID=3031728 RepID=UPI0023AF9435|nr:GNAT family N-acetyltransferase [Luteipulveratus sp. YIM 133132]MDE9366665.1 GNAT family N-acetyltransferase [Luteipulveratus sp. YIM 133132]